MVMLSRDLQIRLHDLLQATDRELHGLLSRLTADSVDPVELVPMLESLELREQERAALLDAVRLEASRARRREEERSIRQFVLRALHDIGTPQTAGFLEDYLYARDRVVTKTRGFASLRRDENKAWRRRPDERNAYVVPCLAEDGRTVPSWMARSDWTIEDRVFVPGVEDLWRWQRVLALADAFLEGEDEHAGRLYLSLIERYAQEARGSDGRRPDRGEEDADLHVQAEVAREEAAKRIAAVEKAIRRQRSEAAERLASLPREQLLWGVTSASGREAVASRRSRAE
jgi:hypothetical protein